MSSENAPDWTPDSDRSTQTTMQTTPDRCPTATELGQMDSDLSVLDRPANEQKWLHDGKDAWVAADESDFIDNVETWA